MDAAAALNIPLNDVSDSLIVKQDRANRFELTPVWARVEPPAKRAKTAEVRLSSASDVPMTPRSDDMKKRIPTSVPSLLEWTHELWNVIALVTQMRRFLVLTYLAGWRRVTLPFFPYPFGSSRIGSSSCWARIVTFAGKAVPCFCS